MSELSVSVVLVASTVMSPGTAVVIRGGLGHCAVGTQHRGSATTTIIVIIIASRAHHHRRLLLKVLLSLKILERAHHTRIGLLKLLEHLHSVLSFRELS